MADIKFMNLSENGNPATTDSVLIGNSQDGLKRTTLGTIGNMFSVKGALHFEQISLVADTAASQITDPSATNFTVSYPIQAPDVPGYTFKVWIDSATNGFVNPSHIAGALFASSTVWLYNANVQNIRNSKYSITAVALYVKNELA